MSDPPAIEPGVAADGQAASPTHLVHRLVRANNLMVFLVVCTGLICVAIVQTSPYFRGRPAAWLAVLTWLRIGVPVAALIVTAVVTQRALSAYLRGLAGEPVTVDSIAPTFYRCKRVSMALLFGAALFAAVCLLFGHRTTDVILAALPLGLLLITRPSMAGLLSLTRAAIQMSTDAERETAGPTQ